MSTERKVVRPPWVYVKKGEMKPEIPIAEMLSLKGIPILVRDYDSGKPNNYNAVLIFQSFDARDAFNQVRQHAKLKEALKEVSTTDEELIGVIATIIHDQFPTP